MTATDDLRPGSSADLSRRMDRMEQRQDGVEQKVTVLTSTVERVEANQQHSEKLTELRFNALDSSVKGLEGLLRGFITRIEGIITGEVRLPQNEALMTDWRDWRKDVDADREGQAVLNGQVRLLGRLAVLLATGNLLAIAAAIYATVKP